MPKRKRNRQYIESVLACLGSWTIPFAPRTGIRALAWCLARLAYVVAERDRKIAYANLQSVFGDSIDRSEKRKIILSSLSAFAILLLDLFWFNRFSKRRIEKFVDFDESSEYYMKTSPAIIVTAHFGNWEVMSQAAAFRGEPCVSIAAPLANPFVDRLLQSLRGKSGQAIQTQQGAVKALLKVLKSGRRTGLLLDQNTLPEKGGEFVPFMGLPAPISMAASMLSVRTGAPIMMVYCLGQPGGRYRLFASEPFHVRDGDLIGGTREIAKRMGDIIKRHPGQWLWMYKRWKYIPDDHDGKGYPFYARRLTKEG